MSRGENFMQKLGLNADANKPKKGFWRRQFQKESTEAQRKFDWIFGVKFKKLESRIEVI